MKTRDADTAGKNVIKSPIHYQNIQEITELYLGGEETPVSVVQHFLERIERIFPNLSQKHVGGCQEKIDPAPRGVQPRAAKRPLLKKSSDFFPFLYLSNKN